MVFASDQQRKKVMALLNQKGFAVKPAKITLEKNFYRVRVKSPKMFKPLTFRNLDIGKKKEINIIRAKPYWSNKFQTQAILVEKKLIK